MLLSNLGFVFPFMQISFINAILFMMSYRLLKRWLYAESAHENEWFGNFMLVNLPQVFFYKNYFKFLLKLGYVPLI